MNARYEDFARLIELRRVFRGLFTHDLLDILDGAETASFPHSRKSRQAVLSRFQYFELAIRTAFVQPSRSAARYFLKRYDRAIDHPGFRQFLDSGGCNELSRLLLPMQEPEVAQEWDVIPEGELIRILDPDDSLVFAAFLDLHYGQLDLPLPIWRIPGYVDGLGEQADVFYAGPSGRFYEWNQIQGHAALYAVISGVIDYGLFFENLDAQDRRAFSAPIMYWLPEIVELGRRLLPDSDSPRSEAAWPWHTEPGAEFPGSTCKAFQKSHKTLERIAALDMGPGFDPSPGNRDDDPDESLSISFAP